jgi:FKBP-type peptidyl-prolyl cis-trans isomerase
MKLLSRLFILSTFFLMACANSALPPVTMDNGLIIQDLKVGSGDAVESGQEIEVHYTGVLEDGTQFDSSRDRSPFEFTIGEGYVIQGWEEGISGMQEGGVRKLTIPSDMAYGERAVGSIPANSTLIFEVELLSIQ